MKKIFNFMFEDEIIEEENNVEIETIRPKTQVDYEEKLIQRNKERIEKENRLKLERENRLKEEQNKKSRVRIDLDTPKNEEKPTVKEKARAVYKMSEPISPIFGNTKNEEKIIPLKLDNRVVKSESPLGMIISPISGIVKEKVKREEAKEEVKEEVKIEKEPTVETFQLNDNFYISDYTFEEDDFLDEIIDTKNNEIKLFDE